MLPNISLFEYIGLLNGLAILKQMATIIYWKRVVRYRAVLRVQGCWVVITVSPEEFTCHTFGEQGM